VFRWGRENLVKIRHAVALLVAVLWSVLAVGGPALAAGVSIGDNFYSPATVTINAGDSVTWTNGGAAPHSVTSNDGLFDSSPNCPNQIDACIGPGGSYSHTFSSAGSFDYYCKVHGFTMSGTVVVEAVSTSPGETTVPPTGSPLPNTGAGPLTGPFVVLGFVFLIAGGALLLRLRRRA
jgi:plastocyanin